MKNLARLLILVGVIVISSGFGSSEKADNKANNKACYGQAAAVFAMTGEMGKHSSSFDTPRLGLRNLARSLYEAGIIADDSMESLGKFVAEEFGIDLSACQ